MLIVIMAGVTEMPLDGATKRLASISVVCFVGIKLMQSAPLTQRRIDAGFLVIPVLYTFLTVTGDGDMMLVRAHFRHASRALIAVLYLKSEISAVCNLFEALVACWNFLHSELCVTGSSALLLCGGEIFTYVCITTVCMLTETWFADWLQNEAEAIGVK